MITILSIGKLKETWWKEACSEYIKRLSPYLKIKITEIPETALQQKNNANEVKKSEAEKILKYIKKDSFTVALSPDGKSCTSEDFSKKMQIWTQKAEVMFIIGGPLGLDSEIFEKAEEKLSLSSLTFTHQMARVILL